MKSNKLLSFKELFANSLRWNLNFSFSLSDTCVLNHVKKINIYRGKHCSENVCSVGTEQKRLILKLIKELEQ